MESFPPETRANTFIIEHQLISLQLLQIQIHFNWRIGRQVGTCKVFGGMLIKKFKINKKIRQVEGQENKISHTYFQNIQDNLINTFINIIISQMSNNKKHNKKDCPRHTFVLKSKSHASFYQQSIVVNFCDKSKSKTRTQKTKTTSCYQGPVFNKDYNYLTSSFIISSQKKKYIQNSPGIQNHNKYYNFQQEKTQMLVPKPNSKNMYCNVCKQKYEDYLEHIQSNKHKKKIQNSPFNDYILELQSKYKTNRSTLKLKEKQVVTQVSEVSQVIVIDQSSQIEQLSRPTKRVKYQKNFPQKNILQEHKNPLQQKNKSFKEYNIFYDQLFNRLRNSYWSLLQLNSQNFQYPGYFNSGVPSPYFFDPNLLNYYGVQNGNMDLYQFPYVLQYNPYNNLNMGVAMNQNLNRSNNIKEDIVIQPQFQAINVENRV